MQVTLIQEQISLRKVRGTLLWIVDAPLTVVIDDKTYTIPQEFSTNLASTPRVMWSVFPPSGIYTEAAVVHDYLYSGNTELTRKEADMVFKALCDSLGVGSVRKNLMYAALRLFGGPNYKKS